jgi:hypothetical protein
MNRNSFPPARLVAPCGFIAALAFLPSVVLAQAVSPTATPPTGTAKENETVQLTPFEVRSALDTGYMGSRRHRVRG